MKRSEITALLRQEATAVARKVARMLRIPYKPACYRISNRRGRSHTRADGFSVPYWILYTHPAYRLWYVVHEVCHKVPDAHHHGRRFFKNETEVMERLGWRIVRAERGPYIQEIRELASGWPVCGRHGVPV